MPKWKNKQTRCSISEPRIEESACIYISNNRRPLTCLLQAWWWSRRRGTTATRRRRTSRCAVPGATAAAAAAGAAPSTTRRWRRTRPTRPTRPTHRSRRSRRRRTSPSSPAPRRRPSARWERGCSDVCLSIASGRLISRHLFKGAPESDACVSHTLLHRQLGIWAAARAAVVGGFLSHATGPKSIRQCSAIEDFSLIEAFVSSVAFVGVLFM